MDAYDNPQIFQSVDAFSTEFSTSTGGLNLFQLYGPASSFLTVVNQQGQINNLPSVDPTGAGGANWELEEARLDVEWVHATAPGARIVLVEANSRSPAGPDGQRGDGRRQPAGRLGGDDELGHPRRLGRRRGG